MKTLLAFTSLIGALVLSGCATKMTVRKAVPTLNERGVYYALPRTVVQTTTTLRRDDFQPGLYADTTFATQAFAPEVLKIQPSVSFDLEAAGIESRGEPDKNAVYLITIPKREWLPFRSRSIDLTASEEGLLSKASVEVTDTTVETTLAALTALAGVAGKAGRTLASARTDDTSTPPPCAGWTGRDHKACMQFQEITQLKKVRQDLLSGNTAATPEALGEMLKALNADIKAREEFYFRGVTKTRKESRTFEFVPNGNLTTYDLYDFSETAGVCQVRDEGRTAPPFSVAFSKKAAPEEEEEKRKAVLRTKLEFAERTWNRMTKRVTKLKKRVSQECNWVQLTESGEVVAAPSSTREPEAGLTPRCSGLVAEARLSISELGIAREALARAHLAAALTESAPANAKQGADDCRTIRVVLSRLDSDPTSRIRNDDDTAKGGMFYRVPAAYLARVVPVSLEKRADGAAYSEGSNGQRSASQPEESREEYARKRLLIAQLGKIVSLPEKVFGRNMKYTLTVSAETGALMNFVLDSKAAITKETVEAAKGAIESGIGAKTEAIKKQTERINVEKDLILAKKALADAKGNAGGEGTAKPDQTP